MTIIAQEMTTLPEGATLSVVRATATQKSSTVATYLLAAREREEIKMKVDNVSPASLRSYLELLVLQIKRERLLLTKKPECGFPNPDTIKQFVQTMAAKDMFTFDALTNADTQGNTGIQKTSKRSPNKTKRKNNHSHSGRHAGNANGVEPTTGEAT